MPLDEKIRSGKFALLGEFEPPKGSDFSLFLKNANLSKGRIDSIVVPEMANAVMKASSLGGSAFLKMNGFDPIMQVCCRDRNRLALQADILAAAGLGISSLMAVSGEEISYGDHPQARPVNDLDLDQLLHTVHTLQKGKDMAGVELRGTPKFLLGSIFNAGATGGVLEMELDQLKRKIDAGVDFVITTPVFDLHRFRQTLKKIEKENIAVIPTVLLLKSAGMARYIDRNLRHISIPQDTIQSIQKAPDKTKHCVQLAGRMVSQLKEMGLAGAVVSTLGWEDKLPMVLNEAKVA